MNAETFRCCVCDKTKPLTSDHGAGTGYGYHKDFAGKVCYACCADLDRADMDRTGRAILYLNHSIGESRVSNWPGTLVYECEHANKGNHNIAGIRWDVWFRDHKGAKWHGVQYGHNSQLCHCRRLTA